MKTASTKPKTDVEKLAGLLEQAYKDAPGLKRKGVIRMGAEDSLYLMGPNVHVGDGAQVSFFGSALDAIVTVRAGSEYDVELRIKAGRVAHTRRRRHK